VTAVVGVGVLNAIARHEESGEVTRSVERAEGVVIVDGGRS
jgi:hypothetical protein